MILNTQICGRCNSFSQVFVRNLSVPPSNAAISRPTKDDIQNGLICLPAIKIIVFIRLFKNNLGPDLSDFIAGVVPRTSKWDSYDGKLKLERVIKFLLILRQNAAL